MTRHVECSTLEDRSGYLAFTCSCPWITVLVFCEFDGKTVSIAGFDSGKCVDIAGASLSDGANAVQYTCNASDRQTFDIEKIGDLYRFRARHSGQCLNIAGASTAALARLIQWPCVGAANELWSIVDAGEGAYTLRPSHSGLCMNVADAEERNNAIILQSPCASDPLAQPNNQRWMLSIAQASADDGKWDGPYAMPTVAVAAVALPDGNVLAFSGADQFDYLLGDGRTYTSVFDTRTNQSSVVVVGNTQHDMFCPGITMLADGRVVVTGGKNEAVTSIYDPDAQSWTRSANMQISRGYHSSALTSDGGIFTVGGSWSGAIGEKGGELYRDGQWRRLTSIQSGPMNTRDAAGTYRADNHMWLFSAPNGKIFHAGPSINMHWLGVDGSGEQQRAGTRGTVDAMNGTAVLYDVGKILVTGGAPSYDNSNALKSAYVIDISGGEGAMQTRQIDDSAFSRAFHSSVVLPTGEVVIIGGQATTAPFSDSKSILAAEIWNPQSETFRTVGSMRVPRTYHSAAVLLKDARVWIGGGGYCGNSCDTNHPDAEIFTPPYLLAADGSARARPVISVAPDVASYGQTISVTVSAEPSSFSLIRLGSATHAVNTDQRRIPIEGSALGGDDYALEIPTNRGSLIPGNYYLFAMDDNGTPSIGHAINIQ